jgi:glycerophosphoryl diester phosphodiesterase
MHATIRLRGLILAVLAMLVLAAPRAESARRAPSGTVDALLGLTVAPVAIGHRGFGDNLGEDPSRPIENTVGAVREAFRAGVSVVEVDVQLTKDGEVAVLHDDFLADFTCVNSLTMAELERRLPHVASLPAILNKVRTFNQASGPLRGLVIVELKALSPLCDPADTQEASIVSTVTRVIRRHAMSDQVMFASLSPALLYLAAAEAPDIERVLTISGLQFLTAEQIAAVLGLPVTPIDKTLSLGLEWAEIGPIYRLPGYSSPTQVFMTALVTTGVRVIEADLFFLSGAGAAFVEAAHGLGLRVWGWTANDASEWFFLQSLGVDAIYTNDVPLGVELQAPIP